MFTPRAVIVDCDPGIDDAFALAYLASMEHAGDLEVVGVVATSGNRPASESTRNIQLLASLYGIDAPVLLGDSRSRPSFIPESTVHGDDGLGGAYFEPSGTGLEVHSNRQAFIDQVSARVASRPVTYLALAPLTNAVALQPDLRLALPSSEVNSVVMGGVFDRRGNVGERLEFNFAFDQEATDRFFADSRSVVSIVPLNVTEEIPFATRWFEELSTACPWLSRLGYKSVEQHAQQTGGANVSWLHDVVAIEAHRDPTQFDWATGIVQSERGQVELGPGTPGAACHSVALQAHLSLIQSLPERLARAIELLAECRSLSV